MIPRTFLSTYASNNQQQMAVVFLTDVTGLKRWSDYIPVKLAEGGSENSYANNGYVDIVSVVKTSTMRPFAEYVPVYADSSATDAWQVNATGYIPYGYAGFGSANMVLDFTNGSALDSRVTFTRSTTGTRTNPSGLIESVAINGPRFNYNATTLESLGLLIEEQRTNLLLNSLIDGTNLSTQIVVTTAVSTTLSFYGTGQIVLSGSASSTVVGTGVYPTRTTFTFTPTVGSLTLTVTGTVQYAQLEAGAFATSYIPTAASTVTRAADVAVMTGTNFSSWFNATAGTLYAEATAPASAQTIATISDNTNSNRILLQQGTNTRNVIITTGGVAQASVSAAATFNQYAKAAAAFATNSCQIASNTVLGIEDTTLTLPVVSRMYIGAGAVGTSGFLNGTIKKISYFPLRLTNTNLQALTS